MKKQDTGANQWSLVDVENLTQSPHQNVLKRSDIKKGVQKVRVVLKKRI